MDDCIFALSFYYSNVRWASTSEHCPGTCKCLNLALILWTEFEERCYNIIHLCQEQLFLGAMFVNLLCPNGSESWEKTMMKYSVWKANGTWKNF